MTCTGSVCPFFRRSPMSGMARREPISRLPPSPRRFSTAGSAASPGSRVATSSASSGSSSSSGSSRSEACRKALFSRPMSTNAAWIPARTASTRPRIDVPDSAALVRAIDQQFDEAVVLENGDPRFAGRAGNQDFAFHGGLGCGFPADGRATPTKAPATCGRRGAHGTGPAGTGGARPVRCRSGRRVGAVASGNGGARAVQNPRAAERVEQHPGQPADERRRARHPAEAPGLSDQVHEMEMYGIQQLTATGRSPGRYRHAPEGYGSRDRLTACITCRLRCTGNCYLRAR